MTRDRARTGRHARPRGAEAASYNMSPRTDSATTVARVGGGERQEGIGHDELGARQNRDAEMKPGIRAVTLWVWTTTHSSRVRRQAPVSPGQNRFTQQPSCIWGYGWGKGEEGEGGGGRDLAASLAAVRAFLA